MPALAFAVHLHVEQTFEFEDGEDGVARRRILSLTHDVQARVAHGHGIGAAVISPARWRGLGGIGR
jgi:hypothetical protein